MKLFALKKASRVLASTPNLVPLINSFSPATNALYLPNPVDTKYFEPANAQKLSMSFTHLHDGVDLLITAPTAVDFSTKGSGILLKALSKIKKPPDYRLVIIKHGQDFRKLLELVVKLGLRSKVKIIDPVPNELMPGLYGISDIVVAAISKQEVLGMTALESMACGTPTLNTWSRKYYGDAGFPLLPFGTEALKNLIEHLISDQELRANVARAQLEWVKANHSSEVIAKLLIQIYEDVLQADSANTSLA